MIELKQDALLFSFPEVHKNAGLRIEFQRTLRIPDDDRKYPLPPGLGRFPLRHVDDFAREVPEVWLRHGGIMLPMYQSEALWLNFDCHRQAYPFAIKVATGKINAVSGESWREGLDRAPQDYVVAPDQPWLDGYSVERGVIRQFVAMPLGSGYSAEEQITGEAEHGGLQVLVYPMKADAFERYSRERERLRTEFLACPDYATVRGTPLGMGLSPGGRMRQEIYDDPYRLSDWDLEHGSRCFVHIANSLVWRAITRRNPPTVPPTAREYTEAGLPWFEYYGGDAVVGGSKILDKLKSVAKLGELKKDVPLPENDSVDPGKVIVLRKGLARNQVREGRF